jgi:phosphoribosylanthranilate isomerase
MLSIKASEIGNLTDARYFSAMGVHWLGFMLDPGQASAINATQLLAIREWLSGPKIVAELGAMSDAETLQQAIEVLKVDALQVGQFTDIENVKKLSGQVGFILEQVPESLENLSDLEFAWREWADLTEFFLLDLGKNGFSWTDIKNNAAALATLKELCANFQLMLSLSFEAEQLTEIINTLNPYGISLKGGAEEKVGVKSFEELDVFFENLEALS